MECCEYGTRFITEELFTKDLNMIITEERQKQEIIKITLKMPSSKMEWVWVKQNVFFYIYH
jgi:hypothetical protein